MLLTRPWTKEFLLWDYVPDVSICDELVEFHRGSDEKRLGMVSGGYKPDKKDSSDVELKSLDLLARYEAQLQSVVDKYIEKFPYCNDHSPWTIIEPIWIQHYAPPTQAFKAWHAERNGCAIPFSCRHLVFMTYLNDVQDGGETEWYHQEVKLSPRKGMTAIWPADWTYTHRGVPSKTEHKYIVTGWFSYYSKHELGA